MPAETTIPAIGKAAWQPKIFAATPRRSELLALKPDWPCRRITLRVHRNMPFEFVASALPAFLAYADLEAKIDIGDYDDSLNFQIGQPADCELIWLDYARYAGKLDTEALAAWLKERLLALRASSTAPILVANGGGQEFDRKLLKLSTSLPGCHVFPRQHLQNELGADWFDNRIKDIGANTMSDAANLAVAQTLGLVFLPGEVSAALKAVALDLDNTLYSGVLGEDGIEGIKLTDAHLKLQQTIKWIGEEGFLLALLSRNEEADVKKLFETRKDFPLRWDDFSAASIGWHDKSEGLRAIAKKLRIDPDAMLVLDDNPGEIANLARHFPATPILYAADPELSNRALTLFPRLERFHSDKADMLRAGDLKAAETRAAAHAVAADPVDYMRSLEIKLRFWLDSKGLLRRLADLANKTNQFALSLARFNEAEIARRLGDPRCATIAAALSDKLSDSGVIAAIFCRAENQTLIVDEICVSCRALGRGVEDLLISAALKRAQQKLALNKIAFAYNRGPRNDPARKWLEQFTGSALPDDKGICHMAWADIERKHTNLPVTISWEPTEHAA